MQTLASSDLDCIKVLYSHSIKQKNESSFEELNRSSSEISITFIYNVLYTIKIYRHAKGQNHISVQIEAN